MEPINWWSDYPAFTVWVKQSDLYEFQLTDCFNFVDSVLVHQKIEEGVQIVEECHNLKNDLLSKSNKTFHSKRSVTVTVFRVWQ